LRHGDENSQCWNKQPPVSLHDHAP
jgi:hypothetical protein